MSHLSRYTYVVMESFTVTETEGQADSYHSAESGGSMTIARYYRVEARLRSYWQGRTYKRCIGAVAALLSTVGG